jgi:hypothetical protein
VAERLLSSQDGPSFRKLLFFVALLNHLERGLRMQLLMTFFFCRFENNMTIAPNLFSFQFADYNIWTIVTICLKFSMSLSYRHKVKVRGLKHGDSATREIEFANFQVRELSITAALHRTKFH